MTKKHKSSTGALRAPSSSQPVHTDADLRAPSSSQRVRTEDGEVTKRHKSLASDLRAASRLVVSATTATTSVVEEMHKSMSGPAAVFWPLTGLVYSTIRGVARAVGVAAERALLELAPVLGDRNRSPETLAVIAALNGVVGDVLEDSGNALALEFELLRREGSPAPSSRVAVLVHGSSMIDLQWTRGGHDHGAALERELGFSAVYARYNSGLHVSTNGHRLAAALERLVETWPVPIDELVLVGFSMGGLVARSACHAAEVGGLTWRRKLKTFVSLGTPHHGSPVERAGNWFHAALDLTKYSAPLATLGKVRSAGVTDLRFGSVLDADWQGRDRFLLSADERTPVPLPKGVRCFALAATQSARMGKKLRGDGLVPVESALGQSANARFQLAFPPEHQGVIFGAMHLDLLSRPEAWDFLRLACAS